MNPLNFNAHHSPVGAYLTFTCGHHGTRGGLAAQLGKPANQDLFIGYKNSDRYTRTPLQVLPFFNGADKIDPLTAFTLEQSRRNDPERFSPFTDAQLTRDYHWSTDRWKTTDGTLEFNIYTPWIDLPDPATATPDEMRNALLPAITAELIIDNRIGSTPKTGFFAINFQDPGNRLLELGASRVALAHRAHYGLAAELFDMTAKGSPILVPTPQESPGIRSLGFPSNPFPFLRWWPHEGLEDRSNPVHLLGTTPGIGFEVPPAKRYTLRLALACHLPGIVTTRLEGRYLYTRHYQSLEEVLTTALDRFCDLKQIAKSQDQQIANSGLNENQQFLIAHSTRSYYANTQLLEIDNAPYWIVNEGEYCMMNTLDLAVDHVFWELDRNPWVVKNLLDNFLKHYSYIDQVKVPQSPGIAIPGLAPGGISFTHDQGTHNQFSPHGQSAYELKDLTGCFSYMTQEQLCNWILVAACYVAKTSDIDWVRNNLQVLEACALSLAAREVSEQTLFTYDSANCGAGTEITTYDSLDDSLGRANGSAYLAMKRWAAYLAIEKALLLVEERGDRFQHARSVANDAYNRASQLVDSIIRMVSEIGIIPGVFDQDAPGFFSLVLPVIEALVYPLYWTHVKNLKGLPVFELQIGNIETLRIALGAQTMILLREKGRNKFEDGGIKLSSTSNNSWLSKIAIVQHVARSLFNLDENGNTRATDHEPRATGWERADAAHVHWLTTGPGAYWCASDQIVNGEAKGSKYYPRLITTALWLREVQKPQP